MSFSLYRKYRPKNFAELVGQETIRVTILEALKQGKVSHAYLFSGPRGTGKTSAARLIAKAIQCENRKESGEPCGECSICTLNQKNELIDLIEIDAASNRGIDDIRDLREKIKYAPSHAKSKVYIIDEVHMLSKEAFNALLKSLEEPPSHVYFILASTEIHKIPETIISRCQRFDFKRISEKHIIDRLKIIAGEENIEAEIEALELIAKYADGGLRDAISILQQFAHGRLTVDLVKESLGLSSHEHSDALYAALGSGDTKTGLEIIESIYREGFDLQEFTSTFLGLLRKKMHSAVYEQKANVIPKIMEWISYFDEAWIKLKKTSIAQLPLEIAIIKATQKTEVGEFQERRQEGLIHIEAVKKKLPDVYKSLENPVIKSSFQTANLVSVNGKILTFEFSSKFHFDKANSTEGVFEIEHAIHKNIGEDIKVLLEMDSTIKELTYD